MINPQVSIIVAVFNGSQTLEACLNSCLEQDYSRKQLIVIDGGSTDGTISILEKYSPYLSYWVSEPDEGIYHAWNKALREATGEWICFMGADDTWTSPSSLSQLVSIADYPAVNFVCAKIHKLPHEGEGGKTFGEPWSYERMKNRMTVAHAGMLHHKSLFEKYGKFNQSYRIAGDYEFLLRAGRSISGAYLSQEVVLMGGGGLSSTSLHKVFHESRRAHRENPEVSLVNTLIFTLRFLARWGWPLIQSTMR